ncbi:MAG TPA: molybdenum cofactor biosynthesis protein MoaE [Acidimicrobiales bacterium]|nr:molybdenum cofactor biosynthesis protein MoaE [Acidimicrobiales bacterium]
MLRPPLEPAVRDWIAISDQSLPTDLALDWASQPDCGGMVSFCGTVRDHSDGRPGVTGLEYEVYPEQAVPRLEQVAATARHRWSTTGRLVLLHRIGPLAVGEVSVVVVASTPHRAEAFDVARFCIDTLKRTVPIWKKETWSGGSEWTVCDHHSQDVGA